jgi:hypothetical protein
MCSEYPVLYTSMRVGIRVFQRTGVTYKEFVRCFFVKVEAMPSDFKEISVIIMGNS